MKIIGIVVEYNPFHNGHIYQIKKIKELYKDSKIIIVMSSSFTLRGEISILDKWEKTQIALDNGIDLVVELPFIYSSNSSDTFSKGAIEILKNLGVTLLIFGSENTNKEELYNFANIQINNKTFDLLVKKYLENYNYPTSIKKSIYELCGNTVSGPNEILAISYIKEIIKQKANIDYFIIKRTSNYNDIKSKNKIISATNIRNKLINNENIKKYVDKITFNYLKNYKDNSDLYFNLIKYKINNCEKKLNNFQGVNDGIENRLIKYINTCGNMHEFINLIKIKNYTENKIQRMLIHILVGLTKEEAKILKELNYIRVLGYTSDGKKVLKHAKKNSKLEIITNYKRNNILLDYEIKVTKTYSQLVNKEYLINDEYKKKPINK